jgi:hypothetical protein
MTFLGSRARFLAILPIAGVLLGMQAVAPAAACACGVPAPRPGQDVIVDKEHAIVSWDGDRERIELLLDMLTDADDVGLIVPTPSPAEVTAGDRQTFVDIEEAIQPKQVTVDDWWAGDQGDGAAGGAAPPVVLDQVQLGPVEATTLEASDADGLTAWLDENGYEIRDEIAAGLDQPGATLAGSATVWAGRAPDGLDDLGGYLTVVDLFFDSPATQIPGDLVVVQAGDDEPLQPVYTVTRPVTVFGIPFGVAVILGAVAGVLIVVALLTMLVRWVRGMQPPRRA